MADKSTRRRFLAGLLAALGAPVIARASDSKTGHGQHEMNPAPNPQHQAMPSMQHGHGGHAMGPMHAWRDPSMPISAAPKLMGRQMGQVHTLNVPPLGYELDGQIKVFTLIAQPVEHLFTDGKPKASWEIIAKNNRYTGMKMDHSYPQKAFLWGYNGQAPGPTIECTQGDTIRGGAEKRAARTHQHPLARFGGGQRDGRGGRHHRTGHPARRNPDLRVQAASDRHLHVSHRLQHDEAGWPGPGGISGNPSPGGLPAASE